MNADLSTVAKTKGWKLLYSIDTNGKKGKGNDIFVVAVIGETNADIVVQSIKGGKSINLVDWHTVYKYATHSVTVSK